MSRMLGPRSPGDGVLVSHSDWTRFREETSPDWHDHNRSVRVRKRQAKARSGLWGDAYVSGSALFLRQEDALSRNHA